MSSSFSTFRKAKARDPSRITRPFKNFLKNEAISGILLISSVMIAIIIANSTFHDQFEEFWMVEFGISVGKFSIFNELHIWINDFLMTLFFLLVGLEIKRELLIGELSTVKRALLPTIAALGGMIMPALIYVMINPPGSPGARGWAIPMATDIAFALGILFLLGKRVPTSIRIFLASLAIVDDIGAVLVIAFFYSETIIFDYIIYAGIIIILLILLNYFQINRFLPYLLLGLILWYFVYLSGIHATIAGVILAFTIPARTKIDFEEFRAISSNLVVQMNNAVDTQDIEGRRLKLYQNSIQTLERACNEVQAPLQKFEHSIAPLVTFVIMPIFALSNSIIVFKEPLLALLANRIVIGVILGLLIGKPLGIFGATYVGVRLGIIEKPPQISWLQILGTGFLGGIGFTMAIFISALAFPITIFPAGILIGYTKIAILIASTLSSIAGITILVYSAEH